LPHGSRSNRGSCRITESALQPQLAGRRIPEDLRVAHVAGHYAPINRELHPEDAKQFGWKAETGTVQSYQHVETHRHIHIGGPTGQFYDQQKTPITQEAALDRAMGAGNHHAHHNRSQANLPQISQAPDRQDHNQGLSP
jgi:hypothetical protein